MTESSDGARILSYLALVGEGGAPLIRETLGLSKMRVYRAIHPLVRCGRVTVKGRNRMTTYALSQTEASKVVFN
jgi:DNA-binding IclR family transcriptional regulator